MNQELFDSMNRQMTPSPEIRAELDGKLAQPTKKRPVPWVRYGAAAACAALVIGGFSLYQRTRPQEIPLHSYVTVEGLTSYADLTAQESTGTGSSRNATEDLPAPNIGALPEHGDAPMQEEASAAYWNLLPHVNTYPDWYGGCYIDGDKLMVCLVEREDPGDQTLELQVLEWVQNGHAAFRNVKYSLAFLRDLQEKVTNAMIDLKLDAGIGVDEERNRVDLTISVATDEALAILAQLDPEGDAIYVQVGQRVSADIAEGEDPAVSHVMPGGATVPDDEDLIAEEPIYDGAHYDLEQLPDKLPGEERPADTVQSVPEGNGSASTSSFDPNSNFSSPFRGSQS